MFWISIVGVDVSKRPFEARDMAKFSAPFRCFVNVLTPSLINLYSPFALIIALTALYNCRIVTIMVRIIP
jgi:hypothetical protein